MGWIKFRSGRTLECHLGGTPLVLGGQDVLQSSEQNAAVVQMFLGNSAPQPAPKGQLYAPGCSVHYAGDPGFPAGPFLKGWRASGPGPDRAWPHGVHGLDFGS